MKQVLTTCLGYWLTCLLVVLVAFPLVIGGSPAPVSAQEGDNNTALGPLELKSTFQCISVYSNFSGDDDGDNQATLEYRESGGSWLPGIPMTVDRRDTVISGGSNVCSQQKWDNSALRIDGHLRGHCPNPWRFYYRPFLLL